MRPSDFGAISPVSDRILVRRQRDAGTELGEFLTLRR